jgi:hypothetical protein
VGLSHRADLLSDRIYDQNHWLNPKVREGPHKMDEHPMIMGITELKIESKAKKQDKSDLRD